MRVRSTAVLLSALLLATPGAVRAQTEVTVQASTVASLDTRLQAFAQGLTPAERAAWTSVLRQAAAAPADNPAGVAVRPTFYNAPGAPGAIILPHQGGGIIVQGGRTASDGIVVQGGRTAQRGIVVQGGRTQAAPAAGAPSQGSGASPAIIVQGGTQPGRAIGPGGGCLAMAPRPGEAAATLDAKLHAFGAGLPAAEQATFDWLLQRAATQGQRGPGGLPATVAPTLGQALGVVSIGPKPEDPTMPPPANLRVVLRF